MLPARRLLIRRYPQGFQHRSDQFARSAALSSAVHVRSERWKVVRRDGSQRGSRTTVAADPLFAKVVAAPAGPATAQVKCPVGCPLSDLESP